MPRELERQLLYDQRQFQCLECSYERTTGDFHQSRCPRCGGDVVGPMAEFDG